MAIPQDHKSVASIVPVMVRERLREIAAEQSISVSVLLYRWITEHLEHPPVERSIRSNGRELFVSLPQSLVRRHGLRKGEHRRMRILF